jgi:hypothetical protein
MIEHFRLRIEMYGERSAVVQFRKRMTWYSKSIGPCPNLRRKIPYIQTVAEFDELVGEFVEELHQTGKADARPNLYSSEARAADSVLCGETD